MIAVGDGEGWRPPGEEGERVVGVWIEEEEGWMEV